MRRNQGGALSGVHEKSRELEVDKTCQRLANTGGCHLRCRTIYNGRQSECDVNEKLNMMCQQHRLVCTSIAYMEKKDAL
jgi:hypothetical protein